MANMTANGAERTRAQILYGLPTDGLLSRKPRSRDRYKRIRDMRKDPTIALARAIAVAPVLLAPWSVEKETWAPEGAVELITRQVNPLRAHILKTAFFGCFDFGFAPYEKVYGIDEHGFQVIRKLKPLLQDITDIAVNSDGSFRGLQQEDLSGNIIELNTSECLLLNLEVEGSDLYGLSLMDIVEKPYLKWEQCEEGADRYDRKMAGTHWVIYYPLGKSWVNGVNKDNVEIAKDILRNLESSGAIAIPSTLDSVVDDMNRQMTKGDAPWRVELLADTGGQTGYIDRMKYLDALKVRAFGVPERAVLEGQFGTKAESETHGDLAVTLMETRHQNVCQQINWHMVNSVLRLNYGRSADNSVYIKPAQITDTAVSFLRDVYKAIIADPVNSMAVLDQVDMEALMDRLSVPVRAEPSWLGGVRAPSGLTPEQQAELAAVGTQDPSLPATIG